MSPADEALRDFAATQGRQWRAAYQLTRRLLRASPLAPLLSAADRDDIAQNVAIVAFLRWDRYDPGRGPRIAWIAGMVKIEVRRWKRLAHRAPVVLGGEVAEEEGVESESEGIADVRKILATLPEAERRVVEMSAAGFTLREIATRERISPSTALARHRRALRRLAEGNGGGG